MAVHAGIEIGDLHVALLDDAVAGWVAVSPVSDRCVYGGEIVGRRKRLGKQNGNWRDVLLLERRRSVVT